MKKVGICLLLVSFMMPLAASAQKDEIAQLVLNIEKLAQFKKILSDMKKGYQIFQGGYNNIKKISEGNFNIHKTFLDGLLAVSPAVMRYKKIADIIQDEVVLLREYKAATARFDKAGVFTSLEMDYIKRVFSNLVSQSSNDMEDLAMVITAGKLRMSDDERIQAIDRIYDDMQEKLDFLHEFNGKNNVMALQRMKEKQDLNTTKRLHGLTTN